MPRGLADPRHGGVDLCEAPRLLLRRRLNPLHEIGGPGAARYDLAAPGTCLLGEADACPRGIADLLRVTRLFLARMRTSAANTANPLPCALDLHPLAGGCPRERKFDQFDGVHRDGAAVDLRRVLDADRDADG